ncbi:MAG: hypothetical protein QG612_375 [Pseudomonadota bacterium]|nr:hypothetical protein [Pseudomonadota bacterium]
MTVARPDFTDSTQHSVLGELRHHGHRGGRIAMHRSIWGLQLPHRRLLKSLLLALLLTGVLLLLREPLAELWSLQLLWWMDHLELAGRFPAALRHGDLPFMIATPAIDFFAETPDPRTLAFNAIGVVALWWASGLLPDAGRPAMYLLRLVAIIHGSAVLFFAVWPASFPHTVREHIGHGLQQCWALMLLAPWIHLPTLWLFDISWWVRLGTTLLTWAWLVLLAPLLYATHALVLHHAGLLAMPLLQLLFGVMIAIIGFVAIYGWAVSLANARTLRRLGAR